MQQQDAILFMRRELKTVILTFSRRVVRDRVSPYPRRSEKKGCHVGELWGSMEASRARGAHDRQIESNRISNRRCGYHFVVNPSCLRAELQEGRTRRACRRKPSKSRRKGLQRRAGSNSNTETGIRSLGSGAARRASKNNGQTESELICRRGCGRVVDPPSKRRSTSCQSDLKMLG
jgi:hypothetical protein